MHSYSNGYITRAGLAGLITACMHTALQVLRSLGQDTPHYLRRSLADMCADIKTVNVDDFTEMGEVLKLKLECSLVSSSAPAGVGTALGSWLI